MYVTKLNFIQKNANNFPKKMKSMYLRERLNLYQLIMQIAFVTNVNHIKMQNENYFFTSNKENHQNTLLVPFQGVLIHVVDHNIP
jgi:hypothetical protein